MNGNLILGGVGLFVGGAITGWVACRVAVEGKVRSEYQESSDAFQNAMRLSRIVEPEAPADNEDIDIFEGIVENVVTEGGEIIVESPIEGVVVENNYHKAISAVETGVEVFVDGGINDYGMSYIEEEDYLDEDGRFKGKIDIMMDEHNPIFIMDGQPIDDWDARIGDSILVDFFKLVPPGADDVLYVRNHRTDEDYEVVRVVP